MSFAACHNYVVMKSNGTLLPILVCKIDSHSLTCQNKNLLNYLLGNIYRRNSIGRMTHESTHSSVNFPSPCCLSNSVLLCTHHAVACTAERNVACNVENSEELHCETQVACCGVCTAEQESGSNKTLRWCENKRHLRRSQHQLPLLNSSGGGGDLRSTFLSNYVLRRLQGFHSVTIEKGATYV